MKKIKSSINHIELVNSLCLWATGVDGYNGALGGIYEAIPWSDELEARKEWAEVKHLLNDAIGIMPTEFDINKIVCGYLTETARLNKWATDKANAIEKVYNKIINDINNYKSFTIKIKVISDIVNSVCQYKDIDKISAENKYLAITKLFNRINDIKIPFNWDINDFYDMMYDAYYRKTCVHLGGYYFVEWVKGN